MKAVHRSLSIIATIALTATCLILVAATIGTLTRTWQAVPVLSGSMEPTMSPGDLAFATRIDQSDVRSGDVIIFHAPDTEALTVHRVVTAAFGESGLRLVTRGDANESIDPWGEFTVRDTSVWKVRSSVPGLGRLAIWARSPIAQAIALTILVLAVSSILSRRRYSYGSDGDHIDADHVPAPPSPQSAAVPSRDYRMTDEHVFIRDTEAVRHEAAAWEEIHADLIGQIEEVDPYWGWSPFEVDGVRNPRQSLVQSTTGGTLRCMTIDLFLSGVRRTGLGVADADNPMASSWVVSSAIASAARTAGVHVDVEAARRRLLATRDAAGAAVKIEPPSDTPASPRRSLVSTGIGVTLGLALTIGVLGSGIAGPGALATMRDQEVDELQISSASLGTPTDLTAASPVVSTDGCRIDLNWRVASGGPEYHEIWRQPLSTGISDADPVTGEPTPIGPSELVGQTSTGEQNGYTDTITGTAAISRYRYTVRAVRGGWVSAYSASTDVEVPACAKVEPPIDVLDPPVVRPPVLLTPDTATNSI